MQTIRAAIERLSAAEPAFLLGALALYVGSLFIAGARWRLFVRALGGQVGVRGATLAITAAIAVNNLTPSSRLGGEACRVTLVRMRCGTGWREATTAAVWDRVSELPCMAVLAVASAWAIRGMTPAWRAAALVLAAALGIALAAVGWRQLHGRGPAGTRWTKLLAFDRVTARVFAIGVAWSVALWLQDVVRLAVVARAFGVSLTAEGVALLSILTVVGGFAPTVGGVGAVEGGLVAGLMALGVDPPAAIAITAGERAISYGFATAAGVVVIATQGGHSLWATVRSRRMAAGEEQTEPL